MDPLPYCVVWCGTLGPNEKNGLNRRLAPTPLWLAPPPLRNSGSVTELMFIKEMIWQKKEIFRKESHLTLISL